MLTNFSIQKNLETDNTEALNGKELSAQQSTGIEERKINGTQGYLANHELNSY